MFPSCFADCASLSIHAVEVRGCGVRGGVDEAENRVKCKVLVVQRRRGRFAERKGGRREGVAAAWIQFLTFLCGLLI